MELRDYQERLREEIRDLIRQGNRTILVQAWMGSGKTVLAADIIRRAVEKSTYTAFLAHRRELVNQASDKLEAYDVPHGIIMAGAQPLARHVQVCSIQTLYRRAVKDGSITPPAAGLVFIDEAHHATAKSYRELMEKWPDAVFIGLTATPANIQGRGLGNVFEALVQGPTMREMLDAGWLVPPRYFAPSQPDLDEVTIRNGDYASGELESAMDQPTLVGDVVTHWERYAPDRPTVVFASGVRHAVHLAEEFRASGVAAEVVHGKTDKEERDRILEDLEAGHLQVVVNCQVLTEGWDFPRASCCVLARPTKSLILYLQMVGRVLRPADGKEDALVLDHAGAVFEHGFIDEFEDWTLEPGQDNKNPVQEKRKEKGATLLTCENCLHVYSGRPDCPNCGTIPDEIGKGVAYVDGQLGEIRRDSGQAQPSEAQEPTEKTKHLWFRMLWGHAELKGHKRGWAYYAFRDKFGHDPERTWWKGQPLRPNDEVARWIKYRNIKLAKQREKERAQA